MKRIKKLMALLLAVIMVVGMTTAVFAAGTGEEPVEPTLPQKAIVYGVEEEDDKNITVTAYQIISYNESTGNYNEIIKDSITKDSSDATKLTPTASDIQKLAANTTQLTNSVVMEKEIIDNKVAYTSSKLTAGSWMIIVTGSEDHIYNPAIISVNKTAEGDEFGDVDLDDDKWPVIAPSTSPLYLKKTTPEIVKTAKTPEVQGVQYGDVIEFEIKTTVPSYTTDKKNIVYKISDTLKGLSLVVDEEHHPKATVGGNEDQKLTEIVTTQIQNGKDQFSVDLSNEDTWIIKHGNQEIVLTYYAKVTSEAKLTVDELNNTATLDYSTYDETGHKADDTKHYTFGIDTGITAAAGSGHTTGEFIKMNDKGDVEYKENGKDVQFTEENGTALQGAKFKLVYKNADGEEIEFKNKKWEENKGFVTDNTGRLEINGLDSDVEYWLIETVPPAGYTLNNQRIRVKIDAQYDDTTGELESYSVVIGEGDNQKISHYKWNGITHTATNNPEDPGNPFGFKNTKLTELPSTGGMGTTIFTIAGCAIMIAAVGLFFASRKKQNK